MGLGLGLAAVDVRLQQSLLNEVQRRRRLTRGPLHSGPVVGRGLRGGRAAGGTALDSRARRRLRLVAACRHL